DFTKLTALVVEDDEFIRMTLKKLLVGFSFQEVLEAANGMEGVNLLDKNPDIIICDINMEPLNGFEFAKHVRALKSITRNVPIIFLTGDAKAESVHNAIDVAADSYLLKPVTPGTLKKRITALLGKRNFIG